MRKTSPEAYRRAAELIASGTSRFSCIALMSVSGSYECRRQYRMMFGPLEGNEAPHPFWNKKPTPERRNMRVLALLFMAEIVENRV